MSDAYEIPLELKTCSNVTARLKGQFEFDAQQRHI